jgi:hypothetical protein
MGGRRSVCFGTQCLTYGALESVQTSTRVILCGRVFHMIYFANPITLSEIVSLSLGLYPQHDEIDYWRSYVFCFWC